MSSPHQEKKKQQKLLEEIRDIVRKVCDENNDTLVAKLSATRQQPQPETQSALGRNRKSSKKTFQPTAIRKRHQELGSEGFRTWIQQSDVDTVMTLIDESGFAEPLLRKLLASDELRKKIGETLAAALAARASPGKSAFGDA